MTRKPFFLLRIWSKNYKSCTNGKHTARWEANHNFFVSYAIRSSWEFLKKWDIWWYMCGVWHFIATTRNMDEITNKKSERRQVRAVSFFCGFVSRFSQTQVVIKPDAILFDVAYNNMAPPRNGKLLESTVWAGEHTTCEISRKNWRKFLLKIKGTITWPGITGTVMDHCDAEMTCVRSEFYIVSVAVALCGQEFSHNFPCTSFAHTHTFTLSSTR